MSKTKEIVSTAIAKLGDTGAAAKKVWDKSDLASKASALVGAGRDGRHVRGGRDPVTRAVAGGGQLRTANGRRGDGDGADLKNPPHSDPPANSPLPRVDRGSDTGKGMAATTTAVSPSPDKVLSDNTFQRRDAGFFFPLAKVSSTATASAQIASTGPPAARGTRGLR